MFLDFYSSTMTLVWSRRAVGENSHTQRSCQGLEQPVGIELKAKFKTLYSFKTPTWPHHFTHIILVFHWSWFTPTHFFMLWVSCPHIVCFSTWSLGWFLSTAICICQLHLLGSSLVKAIYYYRNTSYYISCKKKNLRNDYTKHTMYMIPQLLSIK